MQQHEKRRNNGNSSKSQLQTTTLEENVPRERGENFARKIEGTGLYSIGGSMCSVAVCRSSTKWRLAVCVRLLWSSVDQQESRRLYARIYFWFRSIWFYFFLFPCYGRRKFVLILFDEKTRLIRPRKNASLLPFLMLPLYIVFCLLLDDSVYFLIKSSNFVAKIFPYSPNALCSFSSSLYFSPEHIRIITAILQSTRPSPRLC